MSFFQVAVIGFILYLFVPISVAKYGENCLTSVGEEGKCVPVNSCAAAENFENEIPTAVQSTCDSSDEIPLICCARENIQMNKAVYHHLKSINCGNSGSARVSKGKKAGLFDFRWSVLLKYEGKEAFACGGSLIDERHVLTAAHCMHNFQALPIAVRLGEYDLKNETDCVKYGKRWRCLDAVQDVGIEKYIVHEDYVYKGIQNDIAILRLEHPVKINTKNVRAICLPISKQLQADIPEEFLVAGWGKTHLGNRSNILLWTALSKRSHDFCEKSLELDVKLSDEHICAGGGDNNFRDTCKGDSGSSLFYPNIYVDGVSRAIQYGIVSSGAMRCGEMRLPALYINVAHYMQWITDHMKVEGELTSSTDPLS